MECLAKVRLGMVLVVATASSAVIALLFGPIYGPVFAQISAQLSAQNRGADKTVIQAIAPDAKQIMSQSVAATQRSWDARDQYTYTELDEDRRLDSTGNVKSTNTDFTKMILVNGARF